VDGGKITIPQFLARRVARIWPGHLISLALIVLLVLAGEAVGFTPRHPDSFHLADLAPQILLAQAWGPIGGGGWNLPSWSLSALIPCYAAFPLVWRLFSKARPWLNVGLAVLVVLGVNQLTWMGLGRGLFDLPFSSGVLRALPLFILGAALGRLTIQRPLAHEVSGDHTVGAIIGFVLLQMAPGRFDTLSVGLLALIIALAGAGGVGKPSKLVELGGRLSFSLFITHVLSGLVWFGLLHAMGPLPAPLAWAGFIAALPFSLGVAYLFDRFVDQPIQSALKPRLAALFGRAKPATA
jgi:peptidoglycan/LPS O-acetylase OafA/YrhL